MYDQYAMEESIEEIYKKIYNTISRDLKALRWTVIFCLSPFILLAVGVIAAGLTGIILLLSYLAIVTTIYARYPKSNNSF